MNQQAVISTVENATDADEFKPAFLDDDGPGSPDFSHFRTVSARELFSVRPGQTVAQAAARKAREEGK